MTLVAKRQSDEQEQLLRFQKDLAMLEEICTTGQGSRSAEGHDVSHRKSIQIRDLLNPTTSDGGTQCDETW
jgi:hypothetical protein